MAKFSGRIGYSTYAETAPGVLKEVVIERKHSGDLLRSSRRLVEAEQLNKDLTINNTISVLADPYINGHMNNIRYVVWQGNYWTVIDVEAEYPRIKLRLGGVYNGSKARVEPDPEESDG